MPNYSLKRTAADRLLCYHTSRGSGRLAQALGFTADVMEPETAPDPELTAVELKRLALSAEDIAAIDSSLLAASSQAWRKVSFVIGSAMRALEDRFSGVPDTFFAQRVRALVGSGVLNSQGNLLYMRYCEVRFPVS